MSKTHTDSITNITELRDHAIETLLKLERGDIDTKEAGVRNKSYEAITSMLKCELQYAAMVQMAPNIPFIGQGDAFDGEPRLGSRADNLRLLEQQMTEV